MLRTPIDFNGSSTYKVFPGLALNYLSKTCPGALSVWQRQMDSSRRWWSEFFGLHKRCKCFCISNSLTTGWIRVLLLDMSDTIPRTTLGDASQGSYLPSNVCHDKGGALNNFYFFQFLNWFLQTSLSAFLQHHLKQRDSNISSLNAIQMLIKIFISTHWLCSDIEWIKCKILKTFQLDLTES